MSKRLSERNREIYTLHKKGLSIYKISNSFNLTPPRIFQIIKAEKELLQKGGGNL